MSENQLNSGRQSPATRRAHWRVSSPKHSASLRVFLLHFRFSLLFTMYYGISSAIFSVLRRWHEAVTSSTRLKLDCMLMISCEIATTYCEIHFMQV